MLKNYQEMLEYSFEVFNEIYFNSELSPVVITIMSSPRTNGHFTIYEEWRVGQEHLHEINISAEHLDRPIENICATLIHEMVHYYCQLNGIKDTSQHGRYHNSNFKDEAEKRGLIMSYNKSIGWSITEPSEQLKEVINSNNISKPIDLNRDGIKVTGAGTDDNSGTDGIDKGNMKPKSSTRKYVCPACGNTFRATKDINVICGDCNVQFIKV